MSEVTESDPVLSTATASDQDIAATARPGSVSLTMFGGQVIFGDWSSERGIKENRKQKIAKYKSEMSQM